MSPPRSLLFVPGIKIDRFLPAAESCEADGLIFDLEDSVSLTAKGEAREKLHSHLAHHRPPRAFYIRINDTRTQFFQEDMRLVAELHPDVIMMAKVEHRDEVREVDALAERIERRHGHPVQIVAPIETVIGHFERHSILASSERLLFHFLGYEDLASDLGIDRPPLNEWNPVSAILMENILTTRYMQIPMLDAVCRYFQPDKLGRLREEAEFTKRIGLQGKLAIHPAQVSLINEVFDPRALYEKMEKLVERFSSIHDGSAVIVNEEGGMEDLPSLTAAKKVLASYNKA